MAAKKILLVDDSKTALLMEKMILARGGHQIVLATDGEEALVKAAEEHPDLIILDVVMPRLNGIDACRKLREAESTAHTPIIMVTTRGEEEHVEAAFRNGCTDYLTKPIDGLELEAKVRAYLETNEGA